MCNNRFHLAPLRLLLFISVTLTCVMPEAAAQKESRKTMMRDSLDGKLDFSRFLVEANGFIPVPMLITEPALGGIGGLISPIFITPKTWPGHKGYVPPDITGGFGMYTGNKSWGLGGFRSASFPKAGLKYRVFLGYSSLNLAFYRNLPGIGERDFDFNISALPASFSISKKISKNDIYLGFQYRYVKYKVESRFDGPLPDFVDPLQLNKSSSTPDIFLDWDKRNSIFTPDNGFRIHVEYNIDAPWTGSDFDFGRLNAPLLWFVPFKKNWISGFRFEYQQIFKDAPFYLLPSINLRGIPVSRYQGNTTLVVETEQRYDFSLRWSGIAFVGYGKAILPGEDFSEGVNIYSLGGGFRYLLARQFNLRVGVDIAFGPDSFGYYIVFGHNWNR